MVGPEGLEKKRECPVLIVIRRKQEEYIKMQWVKKLMGYLKYSFCFNFSLRQYKFSETLARRGNGLKKFGTTQQNPLVVAAEKDARVRLPFMIKRKE